MKGAGEKGAFFTPGQQFEALSRRTSGVVDTSPGREEGRSRDAGALIFDSDPDQSFPLRAWSMRQRECAGFLAHEGFTISQAPSGKGIHVVVAIRGSRRRNRLNWHRGKGFRALVAENSGSSRA